MLGILSEVLNISHKCYATCVTSLDKVNVKKRHMNPDNKGERSFVFVLIIYWVFQDAVCVALADLELVL